MSALMARIFVARATRSIWRSFSSVIAITSLAMRTTLSGTGPRSDRNPPQVSFLSRICARMIRTVHARDGGCSEVRAGTG
jgi:hypothetical protein